MAFLSKPALRKRLAVVSLLAVGILYLAHAVSSRPFGYVGRAKKTGCDCHGAGVANDQTLVTISTTATSFEPGKKYTFTVSVENPSQLAAGVDIARKLSGSRLGALDGEGLQALSSELTHTAPKTLVNGKTSWNFEYTAPAKPGFDTIYAVGNAVNGNNSDDAGDQWDFARPFPVAIATSTVERRPDPAEGFRLESNPVRNNARLLFTVTQPSELRFRVLDAAGRDVLPGYIRQYTPGAGEMELDLSHLAAGNYFVSVTNGSSNLCTVRIIRVQ